MSRLLIAVAIVLLPLSLVKVDQRGAALSSMVIQLEKTSPAFAAFQDLQEDYLDEEKMVESKSKIFLAAGEAFEPPSQEKAPLTLPLAINTLKIKKPTWVSKNPPSLPSWSEPESLPPVHKRKEILLAQISREDLKQPSAQGRLRELIEEDLRSHDDGRREIPTGTGGVIVVRKPDSFQNRSPYVSGKKAVPPQMPSHESPLASDTHVTGPLRVTGGLADLGRDSVWRVYRRLKGKTYEKGVAKVTASEANFSIWVQNKEGFVVAEITDHTGRVFGRGQVDLSARDLALQVHLVPGVSTVAARSPSLTGKADPSTVAAIYRPYGSTLLESENEKALDVSSYTEDSRFFIEAFSKTFYPTVAIGFLQALKQIPLYKDKAVLAFRSIVKSFYRAIDIQDMGLVWGQVFKGEEPLKGASVELAGPEGRAIYQNEIGIPRENLLATSESGQFSLVNLPEGVQSARVLYEGKVYPAQIFPSFKGRLTHLELEVPTHYVSHQFHPFSVGEMESRISASLRILGIDDVVDMSENTEISLPDLKSGLVVEMDAGPQYELIRTHWPRLVSPVELRIPAIEIHRIEQWIKDSGQFLDRRLGWAVGFAGESDMEVKFMNGQDGLHRLVYFDSQLQVVNSGLVPAGGGFIAFNLPLGFQTIETRGLHSSQFHAESFVSEPHFLYLIGSQRFINPLRQ